MKTQIVKILFCPLILLGCNNTNKEINSIAYKYAYSMGNYDVETAAQYADEETQRSTLRIAKGLLEYTDTSYINQDRPAEITIHETKVLNDSSAVVCYTKSTPIKQINLSLELRKRDNRWYAHDPIQTNMIGNPTNPSTNIKRIDKHTLDSIKSNRNQISIK